MKSPPKPSGSTKSSAGRPAYVDSHHHAHQLPIVRDALLDVIGHDLLPAISRVTIDPPALWRRVGSARIKRLAANVMGRRTAKQFADKWVWANPYFIGMLSKRDLRRPFPWAKLLANLPRQGVVEWIVHPGQDDPTLTGRDGYIAERALEWKALTDASQRPAWESLRERLSTKTVLRKRPVPDPA